MLTVSHAEANLYVEKLQEYMMFHADAVGMEYDVASGTLYMATITDLYTVDVATPSATFVGFALPCRLFPLVSRKDQGPRRPRPRC